MNVRDRRLGWIGALAGLIGVAVLNVAPLDGLLPVNRALFALICGLVSIWVISALTRPGDSN